MTDDKFPGRQSDPVYLSFVIGHLSFVISSPGRAQSPWISIPSVSLCPSAPPLLCPSPLCPSSFVP